MTTVEVLRAARELLVTKGWGQKFFENKKTGCFCVIGALNEVSGGHSHVTRGPSYAAGLTLARAVGLSDRSRLLTWNDSWARTKDEVLAAFDRAIAAEEAS